MTENLGVGPGLAVFGGLAVVGLFWLLASVRDEGERSFQVKLFLYAIALRFAAAVVLYGFGLVDVVKDEDSSGWVVGVAHKTQWEREGRNVFDLADTVVEAYTTHHKGYYYLLGWFFFMTNFEGRLVAAALNCFFGALTTVFCYRTARALLPGRAATWAGWFVCLFPSLILWSAQTIKEPVVIFLESVALYSCVRLRVSALNPKYLALCLAAILLMIPFRFYAAYVSIAAVVLGLVAQGGGRGVGRGPALIAVAGLAAVIALFSGVLQQETAEKMLDVEYIQRFREAAAKEGSGVLVETDLRTTAGAGTALAVGAVHLLFAPFPWQWLGGVRRMAVAPEVIFWWWLLVRYVVPGIREIVRRQMWTFAPLLLFVLLMAILYSVMFSNVGLVYRQRAQLLPWLFIVAAVGREARLLRAERRAPAKAAPRLERPVGAASV